MNLINQDYNAFIEEIKVKVKASQIKASIKVNEELLKLYWDIAKMIVKKQKESNWGEDFIWQISKDLKEEFPDIKGFSVTNIKYMRLWYLFWQKSPQVVDEIFKIPWGHNREIVNINTSIGVNKYKLENTLPKEFKSTLASIEEIEAELSKIKEQE